MPKNSKKKLIQALSLSQRRIESKKPELPIIQKKHSEKLLASQFRWINEKLYTSDSQTAQTLMSNEWFDIVMIHWIMVFSIMMDLIVKLKNGH
jgi:hypothetical protein